MCSNPDQWLVYNVLYVSLSGMPIATSTPACNNANVPGFQRVNSNTDNGLVAEDNYGNS